MPRQELQASGNAAGAENADSHDTETSPLLLATPDIEAANTEMPRANSCSNSEEPQARTCRICIEEETDKASNPLISPCRCAGSTKYVHRQCLVKWRMMKAGTQAHYRCEICHFRYQFRRLWWAKFIGHPATSAVLFTLLLSASSWLLGYIPITEYFLSLPAGSNIWLHLVNGLLLVGLLGCVLIACTEPSAPLVFCDSWFCYGDPCPYAVVGGGECAGLLMVLVVSLAVAGLLVLCKVLYGRLYRAVRKQLQWAEQMVENVGEAARGRQGGGGGEGGGGGVPSLRRGTGAGAAGPSSSTAGSGTPGGGCAGGDGDGGGSKGVILTPPDAHKEDMV